MRARVKALKQRKPLIVEPTEILPLKDIRQVYYPKTTRIEFAEANDVWVTRVASLENNKYSSYVRSIQEYLALFDLGLAIFENNNPVSSDLDIKQMLINQGVNLYEISTDIGLSRSYFDNKDSDTSYQVDIFRDILDHLGYQLAIVRR